MEQCYTARQMAALLGMSQDNLYLLVKKGQFPRWKVGSHYRFPKDKIERWLEESWEGQGRPVAANNRPANG